MIKNERIIEESDKYDGSKTSKERLSFLFMVAYNNMNNFVSSGKEYKKYLSELLNNKLTEFSNDTIKLINFYNEELKWKEYDNVFNLAVKLFNVLSSFYALKQFITYYGNDEIKYSEQIKELSEFTGILSKKLHVKIMDKEADIDINEFLRDCRNTLIHKGKIICYLDLLPNDDNTKSVPALVIPVNSIWNNTYIEKMQLTDKHGIDSIEIFTSIFSCFNELEKILDLIVKP